MISSITAQARQQSSIFKARWGGVGSTQQHKEVPACQKVAIEVIDVESDLLVMIDVESDLLVVMIICTIRLCGYVSPSVCDTSEICLRSIRMEFEDKDAMMRGVAILVNRNLLQM